MADGMIQRAEDREQKTELSRRSCAISEHAVQRHINSSVFCFLMAVFCPLNAEELPDPTRPPVSIAAPAAAAGAAPAGLQSIIISPIRRAAIIDGETVELGGKHGDARLIEVSEGSVVLKGAQGRQVLTLFPDVKWVSKKELEIKPQPAANKVRTGKQKARPVAQREGK